MVQNSSKIHETAILDEGVVIGDDCYIWHWCHISEGATIGNSCSFGQNVFIGKNVMIGNNVKVQNNVSVFENVYLEDDVFCGPSMVFTNVYNPRSKVNRKNEFKNTIVRKGVTLGANCTIICGIEIGKHAFIGAGALVNKDIKAFALIVGIPGEQIGWMSEHGERIDLPMKGEGSWECKYSGTIYTLKGSILSSKEIN